MASQFSSDSFSDGRQSSTALSVQRGTMRLLRHLGYECLTELTLKTGRRVDIIALDQMGKIIIVEIKSSMADYQADTKWQGYLAYADQFFFAVSPKFPADILPEEVGIIIADQYGAEIIRQAAEQKLAAARRKSLTLMFGRSAAARIHRVIDPDGRGYFGA